ncbi:MAG: hypothetical protein CM15mP74_08530 [Halieaceae bacterium]|nr:MAG: hypothetical protein CM15mP74_08530 [Halieaceae bacterium]
MRGDSPNWGPLSCRGYLKAQYQKVWHTVWNIGGVAYQMPEPGDYLTTELGIDSIIMVRQEDGPGKGVFNSLPIVDPHHRGRGRPRPRGNFPCPHPGWTFDPPGVVTSVPHEEDFAESPCGKARLKEMRCEERFGLIWYNFDPDAPTLDARPGRDDLS